MRRGDEADLTIPDVIDLLADRSEIKLVYERPGSERLPCSIRWRAGVLCGSVGDWSTSWKISHNILASKGLVLPETLKAAAVGGHLGEIVEHPLIPANAVIIKWSASVDFTYVETSIPAAMVNFDGSVFRLDGSIVWEFNT